MFCMLLIAIIVPVVLTVPGGDEGGIVNITDSPTSAPSAPPTGATFAELLGSIQPLYPSDDIFEKAFSSYDSPQYKAADWTANTAPLGYTGSEPRMISRYALAVFYFSTNGDDWERCGVGSTNCDVEREWLTAENECDWLAISCQDPAGGDHTVLELFFRKLTVPRKDAYSDSTSSLSVSEPFFSCHRCIWKQCCRHFACRTCYAFRS